MAAKKPASSSPETDSAKPKLPKWQIHEMISSENLPQVIMNNEEIGYKVHQIFPTGSYFCLLVTLAK